MANEMRSTTDTTGIPTLMAVAFVFGMMHALMPGHGKSVLVSYHLSRATRPLEGLVTGTLLAATHVGMAVALVLVGVAVISRSVAVGGRAPAFELMSAVLIVAIGAYLVFRALRPKPHTHTTDGRVLAIATGLIPCPLTTFILTYAPSHHKLAVGLAAVAAMFGGVVVTLTSFTLAAVLARHQLASFLTRTQAWRGTLLSGLNLGGALAVVIVGVPMVRDRVGWL